jgi:hypothetical protein
MELLFVVLSIAILLCLLRIKKILFVLAEEIIGERTKAEMSSKRKAKYTNPKKRYDEDEDEDDEDD